MPDLLDRWGGDLPPDQVHVVTVPPPGGDRDLLWQRFSRVLGLDRLGEVELDLGDERANPSLGVPETALLRRVNKAVNPVLDPPDYRPLVRELLAHQTLSRRTGSARLGLPVDVHPWAEELGRSWVAELRRRGYDVVGDLDDLTGAPPAPHVADPDSPRESQVAAAAVEAIRALLLDDTRLRHEETRLRAEVDRLRHELAEERRRNPVRRVKERTLALVRLTAPGRALHRAYRRARGRSSRSA